jgi:hypothetical protein
MHAFLPPRRALRINRRRAAAAVLLLSASAAGVAQSQQNTTPVPAPVNNAAAAAAQRALQQQNAAAAAAAQRALQQQNAATAAAQRAQQQQNAATAAAQRAQQQQNAAAAAAQRAQDLRAAATAARANQQNNARLPANRLASLNTNQASNAQLVQSRAFLGHPGPPGSTEKNHNGNIVRTAADGSVLDIRNPRSGMTIHNSLSGSRQVMVEQPGRSRVFVTQRGVPYVQHPYVFRGRAYDHRTYAVQGQVFHQFYRPYNYGGATLDVYATPRYYQPQVYQWVGGTYAPTPFKWGYVNNPPPWYSYYKGYFTPESTYTSPTSWLTDFVLAASLAASYKTAPPGSGTAAAEAPAPVTPEVKQAVSEEINRQVKQEGAEAVANAQNREPAPGAGGVVQELADGQSHTFVVASDLDLVDPSGRRCMVSEGDVVQVTSPANAQTSTAGAIVLTSKGGVECARATQVDVAVADLQEMQNHMRETIDQGMAATDAGKKAPTVTPAFAAAAPPPDANAKNEIDQQAQLAAAVEG